MKSRNYRHSNSGSANDEAAWKKEINIIRKTILSVWHEILILESLHCLEFKDQVNFFEEVRNFEIRLIKHALLHTGGNQTKTARLLGISPSNLNNKIQRHQISVSTALRKISFKDH